MRLVAAVILAMTVAACAPRPAPDWQAGEVEHLRLRRQQFPEGSEVSLHLGVVDSYDGKTLYAGGSYNEGFGSYRSVLFVSRDGGRTWEEAPVWIYGSMVCLVRCLDERHAWFVTCWTIESCGAPYHVFRTRDGGRTWRRSGELPFDIECGLCYPSEFTFLDPDNGIITFWAYSGEIFTYRTYDGGLHWKRIRSLRVDSETVEEEMQDDCRALDNPAYAVETDWEGDTVYVLRRKGWMRTWRVLGSLPRTWRLDGIDVVAGPRGGKAPPTPPRPERMHVDVAIGGGEAASIGSYSVSVFGDAERTDLVAGIVRPRIGSVVRHWVRDLDGDGRVEIAVWLRSAGSGSHGALDLLRLSGHSLSSVPLGDLTKAQARGYMGHDTFDVTGAGLVRSFPVYRPEDDLARPTGGRATLRYDFGTNRWVPLRQTP